jgi:ketosteroid isomerase-like protein
MTHTIEATVREYYRVVGDLSCTQDQLLAIVHPDAVFTEHPNPIAPRGAVRTVAESIAGFRAGRALLREQHIEVLEVLVSGDRAAVRATWSGVVGVDRGPFAAGTVLSCAIAAFATVTDNRITAHDTYDCYPPLPVAVPA